MMSSYADKQMRSVTRTDPQIVICRLNPSTEDSLADYKWLPKRALAVKCLAHWGPGKLIKTKGRLEWIPRR